MFYIADDVLRLLALHQVSDHGAGQQGILSGIFERPSIPRIPRQIYSAPKCHVEALCAQFAAYQRTVVAGQFRIPTGCKSDARRQCGGIASVCTTGSNPISSVGHENGRDPQTRNSSNITSAAIRQTGKRHLPVWNVWHSVPVQESQLFVLAHLLQREFSSLAGWQRLIHPRIGLGIRWALTMRCWNRDQQCRSAQRKRLP